MHQRPESRASLAALALIAMTACTDAVTTPVSNPQLARASATVSALSAVDDLKIDVGEQLFNDQHLSIRGNQSCASCHDAKAGFTASNNLINLTGSVMQGSIPGRFGNRRPMSTAYTATTPVMFYDAEEDNFVGGMFWDGRATGKVTGSAGADQAMGPFLNPAEMGMPDKACVVYGVQTAAYVAKYKAVFGNRISTIPFPSSTRALCGREGTTVPLSAADRVKVDSEYVNVAFSIVAFEGSDRMSPFSSKYDRSLVGQDRLSPQEQQGLTLFTTKANCANCHTPGSKSMFTTFEHYNTGIPANPLNPALLQGGAADVGLGATLNDRTRDGQMKVPTIRNVDKRANFFDVKSYMHNGAFKTLEQVVHFYNTRDVLPKCRGFMLPGDPRFGRDCWPAPEISANVLQDEIGNLKLTPQEEAAIVAFLKTLSDR
jgi:cytochrome c peroxidase